MPSAAATTSQVKVFARVRPFTDTERALEHSSCSRPFPVAVQGGQVTVTPPDRPSSSRTFHFDMCFSGQQHNLQRGSQGEVYAHVGPPLVSCALQGYHACLLAYGQTGSGKTHTILGPAASMETTAVSPTADTVESAGVLPRLIADLFAACRPPVLDIPPPQGGGDAEGEEDRAAVADRTAVLGTTFRVSVKYLEVYCEKAYDLLAAKAPEVTLRGLKSGIVDGLREEVVTSAEDALNLLRQGDRRRTVACTLKNERSSRSHAVFQLVISKTSGSVSEDNGEVASGVTVTSTTSTISLVDLAGSERQAQSGAQGQQFKEMIHINLSLSTLRRVIQVLHDNAAGGRTAVTQPPIRESLLTSLLAPSFGGNSKTLMFIAVSPATRDLLDTIQSLEFGSMARKVVNHVSVNEDKTQSLLRTMSEEIARLKAKLAERRESLRLSRCLTAVVSSAPEVVDAATQRRSIGVSTIVCGPLAVQLDDWISGGGVVAGATTTTATTSPMLRASWAALRREPAAGAAYGVDDAVDDDAPDALQDLLNETTVMYQGLQEEVTKHVSDNARLQRSLVERDEVIRAVRRQVCDLEAAFLARLQVASSPLQSPLRNAQSSGAAPCSHDGVALPDGDASGSDVHPVDRSCGGCSMWRRRAVEFQEAQTSLLRVLNENQEHVYRECERLRRQYLDMVSRVAELRNALNVAEDQTLVIAAQSSRIQELETQVEHHMASRVALLMENHQLLTQLHTLGGGGGRGDSGGDGGGGSLPGCPSENNDRARAVSSGL